MTRQTFEFSALARGTHDGVLVVIDVIRAFTTAAVAFAAGASEILCVETLTEARAIASASNGTMLMGEERGRKPVGFDYGNSPRELDAVDLGDIPLVQRTSNGTRGLAWVDSPVVLAAAATNAAATAAYVRAAHPDDAVRFVATGRTGEDAACARFIAAAIEGQKPDPDQLGAAIVGFGEQHLAPWIGVEPPDRIDAFRADVQRCSEVNRYDFAMVGTRSEQGVILTPHLAHSVATCS